MAQVKSWKHVRRLTAALAAVWGSVTCAAAWFAADLSFEIGGFPLGYWMAAQGALLVYLGIVIAYAWRAEILEARVREPSQDTGTAHD